MDGDKLRKMVEQVQHRHPRLFGTLYQHYRDGMTREQAANDHEVKAAVYGCPIIATILIVAGIVSVINAFWDFFDHFKKSAERTTRS